jgi:hypothetical protein
MKTTLTIILMAVLMLAAFAMPMILAEDNNLEDDSSDAISLYDDTSNLSEGLVISPAPTSLETAEIADELDAEENETASTGEIMMTQFRSWFTFNQEKKVNLELKIAKLRLIQAKIAAKNNNTEAMEKALEAHERIMNKIQEIMSKLESASDAKGLNFSAAKLVGLERAIQVHEARIARLNTLLENANLTDKQREKVELRISKAEEVTAKLQEISDEKQDKIKTKLMAVRNLTESEADDIIEQRSEKIENRIEQRLENRAEKRAEILNQTSSEDSEDSDSNESETANETEDEED